MKPPPGCPHPVSECVASSPGSAPGSSFLLCRSRLTYLHPCHSSGRSRRSSCLLALVWSNPGLHGRLETEAADARFLSLSPPTPCHSNTQIEKEYFNLASSIPHTLWLSGLSSFSHPRPRCCRRREFSLCQFILAGREGQLPSPQPGLLASLIQGC